MRRSYNGFTLIEIMVTIAILGILSSVLIVGVVQSGKKSRDIDRQGDLRELQGAVELYKQRYGRYPTGCNGANAWSGQPGSTYACSSGAQYIVDLAPEFLSALPFDKRLNGNNSGYAYYTNNNGTAYKIIAYRTVESETITNNHPFKSCDANGLSPGVCDSTSPSGPWGGSTPTYCDSSDAVFQITYAVWGGFPPESFASGARSEEQVEAVICRLP
jgi:prepilin-type N-terminal cleavage/methylation domain-containing protein